MYNGSRQNFFSIPKTWTNDNSNLTLSSSKQEYVRTVINVRNRLILHQQIHSIHYGLGTVALLICTENTLLEGYQYKSFGCSHKDESKLNRFMIEFDYDGDLALQPIKFQSPPYIENIYTKIPSLKTKNIK